MMMAAALLFGSAAYAQTPTDGNTGATTQTEQSAKSGKDQKDKKARKGNRENRPKFNPFDGIQLTDDQQQKLQVLQQGLGPVILSPEQQAKIPENKNLTEEQKKQLKEERKAKKQEAKKKYLQGVKETLTPDQYVVFLENWYLYAPQNQGNDRGIKQSGKSGMKPGKKGEKHGGKTWKKDNK